MLFFLADLTVDPPAPALVLYLLLYESPVIVNLIDLGLAEESFMASMESDLRLTITPENSTSD